MPDYSKGQIYTIRNRNDNSKIYVGSTIQSLAVRFGELAPSVVSRDVGGSAGTRCVGSVGGCAAVGARTRLVLRQDGGYGCRRVPFD